MAGEEVLGEDEGDLEGAEGVDSEVGLEGEEAMAGDGRLDWIILWEVGLMICKARKAWRWRHGLTDKRIAY